MSDRDIYQEHWPWRGHPRHGETRHLPGSHMELDAMQGLIVAIAISALLLFFVWYRHLHEKQRDPIPDAPDRSLAGEAVTAFEDIALDIIGPARDRQDANRDAIRASRGQE